MSEIPESNPKPTPPDEKPSEMAKGPFDWRVVLIAVYLFILLLVSVNWLAGLMMANTSGLDDDGKKITACKPNLGSPCPVASPTPAPTPPANANTNSNSTPASVTPSNQAANANRPANIANANTTVTATRANSNAEPNPKATATPTPAPTPNPSVEIADVIVIKNFGLFDSVFLSVCKFCTNGCISGDGFLFLIVLFAGLLGAVVRALAYLSWHIGKSNFSVTWLWYYLFQPFFGAALALIFYVVLRGGFGSGSVGKNNLYSFAAVAFLAGLFSDNAMAKLKLIAESLLVKTEKTPKPPTDGKGDAGGAGSAGGQAARGTQPAKDPGKAAGDPEGLRNIGRDEPPV